MSKNILGIDLGTSSVKVLLRLGNGQIIKSKAGYREKTLHGFLSAIKEAVSKIDISCTDAIGLSSQVGTYIINDEHIIGWNSPAGRKELNVIKKKYPKELFIKEIAMPHPDIISYPIPRLMYIQSELSNITSICQPKDFLCKVMTGNFVTDKYSMRGLAHTQSGTYSDFFLKETGIKHDVLPEIVRPDEIIGLTNDICECITGIPKGIPVFAGLNDFFSSLKGMGIEKSGDMFDITGTSEHIGMLCDSLCADTPLVSGAYFDKFIHYGVTASSGASLDFGLREFGFDEITLEESLKRNPPIFTPYVNGERAPIYSSDARGVFFGINSDCTKKDMAYSVLEGVAFSIYHIFENMNAEPCGDIKVSGGASGNNLLCKIKAELFGRKIYTLSEDDTSALGAIQMAASGFGIKIDNPVADCIIPDGKYREILLKRFNIYKNLYKSLEYEFKELSSIRKD